MRLVSQLRRGERVVDLGAVSEPGNKARNLEWLDHHGARVPQTWVVDSADEARALELPPGEYAVRSSSPDEDTPSKAEAGRYLTELGVPAPQVPDAVVRVLASAGESGAMAAMIQPMVQPVVSGVVFSRNPVTGLSDIVIEAVTGSGEALLQEGSDPMRWVFRNGEFLVAPQEDPHRALVDDVVAQTQRLADAYGPADLEWVWDGKELYWVQIRPITTIEDVPIYSRRIAKEVMPGLVKPLTWSINVPMVNSAWVRLFTEAIGPNDLEPADLARSFAYRSYFDMRSIGDIFELTGMPRDSLENLLGLPGAKGSMRPGVGSLPKLPRLILVAARLATGARRFSREAEALRARFAELDDSDLAAASNEELLGEIARLIDLGERAAYVNIVVPLLANFHMRALGKRLERAGLSIENHPLSAQSDHDPTPLLRRLGDALSGLDEDTIGAALQGDIDRLDDVARSRLSEVVSRFGHLSENVNDISTPRWREDQTRILGLALAASRETLGGSERLDDVIARVGGRSGRRLRRSLRRAKAYTSLRESVGSTYSYGYGLLRPRFLEVGRRLAAENKLDTPEDVFYLTRDVVEDALDGRPPDLRTSVAQEKQAMSEVGDLVMPDLIIGDRWLPGPIEVAERLDGVGVSYGRYRGRARFVASLAESHTLEDGDVLVVEHSDVAWTPLFARAGAVVTAAGGLLAHSSITAREMGVPCVASVGHARLLDGHDVLVDGFEGVVLVERARADADAQ